MKFKSISTILLLTATAGPAIAGPIGYAICQTGKVDENDHRVQLSQLFEQAATASLLHATLQPVLHSASHRLQPLPLL
ncbi:hypothetical protein EV424DRAFT_1408905 [Suillus variegatus]|nr:hypothetical protein EV424DRAFT_1408905 [Suillus variegatus]